jgi:hypothetical protein
VHRIVRPVVGARQNQRRGRVIGTAGEVTTTGCGGSEIRQVVRLGDELRLQNVYSSIYKGPGVTSKRPGPHKPGARQTQQARSNANATGQEQRKRNKPGARQTQQARSNANATSQEQGRRNKPARKCATRKCQQSRVNANEQRPTPTGKRQRQQATSNKQPATSNQQQAPQSPQNTHSERVRLNLPATDSRPAQPSPPISPRSNVSESRSPSPAPAPAVTTHDVCSRAAQVARNSSALSEAGRTDIGAAGGGGYI